MMRCIYGVLHIGCNIFLAHCIFGALHLWCYVYALLVCYAEASLVVPRWCNSYCALCNASLVHCFLVLGAIYFWCCVFGAMHLSAISRRLATAVAHQLYLQCDQSSLAKDGAANLRHRCSEKIPKPPNRWMGKPLK